MARPVAAEPDRRRYVERLNRLRLHQPVFRARMLSAYDTTCAMCRLRHVELLDAAHILADTHPRGTAVVPAGWRCAASTTAPSTVTCSGSAPTS